MASRPRKSKSKRPPTAIRAIVAANVRELRDHIYRELPNATARNKAIAHATGMSPEQARRICLGDLGTTIDYIDDLAQLFGVEPANVMTPYFAATFLQAVKQGNMDGNKDVGSGVTRGQDSRTKRDKDKSGDELQRRRG